MTSGSYISGSQSIRINQTHKVTFTKLVSHSSIFYFQSAVYTTGYPIIKELLLYSGAIEDTPEGEK